MKKEFLINLNEISDLKEFVNLILYKITSDVDAIYENQVVDAKSLMGIITLASHPLLIRIYTDNNEELEVFNSICNKFEVKNE